MNRHIWDVTAQIISGTHGNSQQASGDGFRDTEGAELLILQGARDFLSACHPILVMEIEKRNLEDYPYDAAAIVFWLNAAGYRLETIDGLMVTPENIAHLQTGCSDYVAISAVRT